MVNSFLSQEVLREIIEKLHLAIYIVDHDGKILYINNAAEKMDHLERVNVIGKKLEDVYSGTDFRKGQNSPTLTSLNDGLPHIEENLEWFLKDGTIVNAITSTYPIKVKVLELILVLSRAAIDGGADYEKKVSQINAQFIKKITYSKTLEEISIAANRAFQSYIDSRPVKKPKAAEVVSSVKKFIIANYHHNLTLGKIAKSVYVSPWYLSHMFKEAEGITVIDYLTKVRIEKAKELLRNGDYTINEISEKLGYKEPGYFSKVFRRQEGRTPSQFRKLG